MGTIIGIDLGTTNTAVSVVVDGKPKVLQDAHGYKVLPSMVWVGDDGTVKVGQQCKSLWVTDPGRTAFAVKRLIGRRFGSPEVVDADPRVGYIIGEAPDGSCLVELESGTLTPVEVAAHVLRTAREMAESTLGETIDEAVITVPAYFNHAQRAATLEAATLAGLRCDRLLNEPTAAALAYGFRKEMDRTLVVFDLGGGTFDVSVLKLNGGVYEILSTLGDTYLGGEDFDHRVVDWLAERFMAEHQVDLRLNRMTLHRLKEAAERAKCELSFTEKVEIPVPHLPNGRSIDESLDRATLLGLVSDFVDRSIAVSLDAVRDAGLEVSDIDEVILVGGQTRMPAIRDAITQAFGREPSRSVHPEEVVAMGAAVHAAALQGDTGIPTAVLIDVTPFDLGIDVAGNMFQPIIVRNTSIPALASRVFATARGNQSSVQVTVRQGASRLASENEFLGEFVMSGLTPAPRMETKVEVSFEIDTNGMLRVSAMEPATGKQTEITVRNYAEVAQSKGGVNPEISRAAGAAAEAPEAPEEAEPNKEQAEFDVSTKRPKAKAKKSGGGLLGALFGRKKKGKKAPKPAEPATVAEMSPEPAVAEPSIIEAVIAEREAAASEVVAEEIPEPQTIQLPEIDPSALSALEADMDEPAPIDMPLLDDAALEPLEVDPLGLEPLDLEPLDLETLDLVPLEPLEPERLAVMAEPVEPAVAAPEPVEPPVAAAEPTEEERVEAARAALLAKLSAPLDGVASAEDAVPISPQPAPPQPVAPARKPARLKLSYKNPVSMVREYTENLKKGGCFVKTPRPLAVGRQVLVEVRVAAISDDPICIDGVVTWSSRDLDILGDGEVPGMGIEYQIGGAEVREIQARLQGLLAT